MTAPARIGVLGGVFDPPHIGHVAVAQEAWWRLRLDRVLLVPAAQPADRGGPCFTGERRAAMVEAAVHDHPGLRCSRIELERPGPSYTADTLEALAAAHPGAALWFILGADRLATLPRWHEPHRILACARIAVVPRADMDTADLERLADRVAPGRVDVLDAPLFGVSSTMIRERLQEGGPVRYLVPAGVEALLDGWGAAEGACGAATTVVP